MMEQIFWLVLALSFIASYLIGRFILLKEARQKYDQNHKGKRIFLISGVAGGLLSIYPGLIAAFVIGYPIGMIVGGKLSSFLGNGDSGAFAGFLLGIGITLITVNTFGVIAGKTIGNSMNHRNQGTTRPNQAL